MINISELDKADVLIALYENSKPQGLGWLQEMVPHSTMTREEANELLEQTTYFDYLKGRIMKVDLSGDEFNPVLYDRDNGEGAALKAINNII